MKDILASFRRYLVELLDGQAGQTLAEYGILVAVIAVVVVVGAVTLGGSISSMFGSSSGGL
ncbi:MAG: Flp family type IVb pilin [Solirubrobacteraceae bacterium]